MPKFRTHYNLQGIGDVIDTVLHRYIPL